MTSGVGVEPARDRRPFWGWLSRHGMAAIALPLSTAFLFTLCFSPFLRSYGFFWDDWVQLLSRHLYGYSAYWRYFYERPLSGWTHIVFGPLLGDSPLRWQVFTLTLRWGSVLAAGWAFRLAWPQQPRDTLLAALLFAVYPGFTQQPIAVAYSQHWLQYLLFLLSLAFMLLGVQSRGPRRWIFTLAGLACQALQLSITEFFAGVELIRPALLWVALGDTADAGDAPRRPVRRRMAAVLRAWAPYLLVGGAYWVWRGFFFQLPGGARNTPILLDELRARPLAALLRLAQDAAIDALNVLVAGWGKVFDLRLASAAQRVVVVSWLASLVAAAGLGLYLIRLRPAPGEPEQPPARRSLEWIWVGLLGVALSPLPLWITGQNVLDAIANDAYHADRFTLAAMPWASLLLVGVLGLAVERWKARMLLLAALLGLLAGFQMRVANDYRWLSVSQSRFYWQLAWRAPALQPGTALIGEEVLFPFQGLFAASGAINLLYPQPEQPEHVAYWIYSLIPRLSGEDPADGPVSLTTRLRLFTFQGQTPASLVIVYGTYRSDCLWVLRPEDGDYSELSALMRRWLPASNLARIGREPAAPGYPSPQLFGPEPEHGWCYFFEKADLARQYDDWATAAALGDQARAAGFNPGQPGSNVAYEWLPFLEAYAHVGRWGDAAVLVGEVLDFDPNTAGSLCARWEKLRAALPDGSGRAEAIRTVSARAGCRAD